MRSTTALRLALAFVPVLPATAPGDERLPEARAPDGARGFGVEVDPKRLRSALRDPAPEDQAFLNELWSLARDVEVLAAVAARRYELRGYFVLVPDRGDVLRRDVEALHRAFRQNERRALKVPLGEERGLALARAMADAHFLARMKLLVGTRDDVEQLRHVLRLLVVHAKGHADYRKGPELEEVLSRADLAAARLRAARADLERLYQPVVPEGASDPLAVLQLARFLARGGGEGAEAAWKEVRRDTREREKELSEGRLARFDRRHAELLREREEGSRQALKGYREMLGVLPLTPEGLLPSGLEGRNSERYDQATKFGLAAAREDPLLPELQYMLGLSFDFSVGRDESMRRLDRFLALRGIRHWDHRTYQGRDLSVQEEWALYVVAGWRPPEDG